MKLSEIKGERAIDVLADLLEPSSEIFTDAEVVRYLKANERLKAVKVAMKKHKKAVIAILALTEGEDPETYEPNVLSLPAKFIEIANDADLMSLFHLQGQDEKTFSGSATGNTKAEGN